MNCKVSIIIPTLSNVEGIKYLVNYFKNKKEYQLIIVHNKSQNSNLKAQNQILKLKTNNLIYLPQRENLGYAKANNLGVKYAKAEWLLLLNDDIEFKYQISNIKYQNDKSKLKNKNKNQIEELINLAKKNNFDAVAPILINPDGGVENYGYRVLPIGKMELIKSDTNLRMNANDAYNANLQIDGLTVACLLIKKEVYEKLGGFDESFFAYLEDVDFFLRFKKEGFKFAITPDIAVFHHHRKTSSKMGWFKEKQDLVNWWRLYFKHPDIIRFSPSFLIERARNVMGLVKKIIKLTLINLKN
ncbi:MAG: glycosyltransferase family 2 protein [Microgenomates group bacterium]